jgi:ATP-GRASP peptide maturase of grasp-with-spasm system
MNSIFILTNDEDQTSSEVIKWLTYQNTSFTRFNNIVALDIDSVVLNKDLIDFSFYHQDKRYSSSDYSAYWYRRGAIKLNFLHNVSLKDLVASSEVTKHLQEEEKSLTRFIHSILESKNHIGSITTREVNKLELLLLARSVGLNIPSTMICTSKESANNFFKANSKVVTKSIQDSLTFQIKAKNNILEQYGMLTSEIKKSNVKKLSKKFLPTKLQNKIDKALELRIFVLKDRFYAMAIFSQSNKSTSVDFRNYDWRHPNRNVPFDLPKSIQRKLKVLMKRVGLDSGSVDMVLNKEGDFIFLEINPIGQFGMVSYPCNYYLEKEIAKRLSK